MAELKISVYIATSLDGFIADEDGGLDWLMNIPNPGKSDFGFGEFMRNIDALVMGRKTFETVVSFGKWPYTKPVFVLSRSMKSIHENYKYKVELMCGSPAEISEELRAKGHFNIYVDGGQTIREFMKHGLIDELILSRIPVVLGKGIPLFGAEVPVTNFKHIKTEVLSDTIVKSFYQKVRD